MLIYIYSVVHVEREALVGAELPLQFFLAFVQRKDMCTNARLLPRAVNGCSFDNTPDFPFFYNLFLGLSSFFGGEEFV